jgi:sensor histidine kinase YesM
LNSIQSLIATDNNAEASIYLAKFSRLMRRILQNSRQAYIPLRQEIEFVENYIELEQRRFKEAFEYELDEVAIEDAHFVMIPPLVIQPFIENAIIHGLLRKSEKGTLLIQFEDYNNNMIKCTIKDDGIGRDAAAAFKTDENQESLGIKITEQRLRYLTIKEKMTGPFIQVVDLKDADGKAIGTQVELLLPIKFKA